MSMKSLLFLGVVYAPFIIILSSGKYQKVAQSGYIVFGMLALPIVAVWYLSKTIGW
jgi:hypothetical protein